MSLSQVPGQKATAGTQHPALSRLPARSNAMGHAEVRFSFSPRGLASLLHVSAEAAASGDRSRLCISRAAVLP